MRKSKDVSGGQLTSFGTPLNSAFLAFHALKRGSAPMNGSTGTVLGRSLTGMLAHVDRGLSEVRLSAAGQRRELTSLITFVDEITATGMLHSEYRGSEAVSS